MDDEMRGSFPAGACWQKPEGGMFLWVTLPEGANTGEIYWKGIEQGVAFVPGDCFYVKGGGENALRLNFSFPSQENIVEGVRRLGGVLDDALGG
jgi:2-aminoadipate transaminase